MANNRILIYLCLFVISYSLITEIEEDFDFDIEYRLQKKETNWNKRGKLIFSKNDPVIYKPKISLNDFTFTPEMKKEIKSECEENGNYILQFTNNKNKTQNYYTSIKACDLVNSNFHDKLILNTFVPIKKNDISSINYFIDEDYDDDFDDDDDEEIENGKKGKNKEFTKIELNKIKIVDGPYFTEDDEGLDEISKQKKEAKNPPPQSFMSRYWYIIAIVMFMLMMKGNNPEEEGQGQGAQGQGQAENK